jgi:hypothetical protein
MPGSWARNSGRLKAEGLRLKDEQIIPFSAFLWLPPGPSLREDPATRRTRTMSARTATPPTSLHITPGRGRIANSVGVGALAAQRIAGFVARVWAKIGKMPDAMQRIAGFVARVRAKIGKMPDAMQRIAGFVARPGAQQGKKVLCVQCMQRIAGFVASPGQRWPNRPQLAHNAGIRSAFGVPSYAFCLAASDW